MFHAIQIRLQMQILEVKTEDSLLWPTPRTFPAVIIESVNTCATAAKTW